MAYVKKYHLVSQERFFKKKLFTFYLQKTDKKWGQRFQKKFKHLPFAKKKLTR